MNEFYSQITEDFPEYFIVHGDNRGRYPFSNSMMVKAEGNNAILFDCGFGHKFIRRLKKVYNLPKVILSHWHEDHISGYASLKDSEFHCQVLNNPPLRDMDTFIAYYGLEGVDDVLWEGYEVILKMLKIQPMTDLIQIKNDDKIKISDGINIQVIRTPGHSDGHCCFYDAERKISFLADIDLSGLGPWYGCTDSNINDFEDSIKNLQQLDIEYAITGHTGLFSGKKEISELLTKYLSIIYERDDKVLNLLNENTSKSLEELERKHIVYARYNTQFENYLIFAENVMIKYHLERLDQLGKVKKENSGYILS